MEFMRGQRPRIAKVSFAGDEVEEAEAGAIDLKASYLILVGWRNERIGAAARRGDDQTVGVNRVRDLLRYALHNQRPDVHDGVTYADSTKWMGFEIVAAQTNLYVIKCGLQVLEVPKA